MSIHTLAPEAGKDYPRNWSEFLERFVSEQACLDYLEWLRWPRGFVCPRCGVAAEPYRSSRGRLMCASCSVQSTVTAGTIFEKTRTPLRVWLAAAWYVTNQKHGVSALGLQRVLGLGSYQTAWTMLHRLRRAMVRPERERLHGIVEVDETYLAISDRIQPVARGRGKGRKSQTHQTHVVIAVELLEPKGFGRLRLQRINNASAEQLIPFVLANVEPGSQVRTDGSAAYRDLADLGYVRHRTVHLGSDVPAHVSMVGVHRVAALVKRWVLGTHQGAVQPGHLDAYLDEFVFRFNRRTSRSRGLLFYRLLEQAVVTDPLTYRDVVDKLPRATATA
ncbi:IS1595 family transposase [Xenophilus sp. Marseille-Q4582]|uniref:IS1595 family transposase n=1 Tax=Xenophilus sp. Marseille-Q4582 TaxID=2866600 RepID=UPI001CE3D6E9|nr:IS1595 family transposase [Xenophilus sp. Marseille-Q4582]